MRPTLPYTLFVLPCRWQCPDSKRASTSQIDLVDHSQSFRIDKSAKSLKRWPLSFLIVVGPITVTSVRPLWPLPLVHATILRGQGVEDGDAVERVERGANYKCVYWDVHFGTRLYPRRRNSRSELWHSNDVLKPRCTPRSIATIVQWQGSGTID